MAGWLFEQDLREGKLIDLFPIHQATATSYETAAWLLYPSRHFLPARVRASIECLRRMLGS